MNNDIAIDIQRFRTMFSAGIESIKEAAKIYVSAIDRCSGAKAAFREALPQISHVLWADLEKVGRGQIHEKLLLCSGRSAQMMRTLNLSEQTEILDHGVQLLLHDGTIISVMHENLTQSQISQVFVSGHVRSVEAQRAWMESQREYKLPQPIIFKDRYKIEGNLLVVSAPTSISCSDLKKIIAQMEDSK